MNTPTTLEEAIRYFSDLDVATDYVAGLRWPDGFICPHCGGSDYSYISTRRLWKCKSCAKQSSVKVGTIFEGSALGLDKWLAAIWLEANTEGGVSSHELARALGTTQKSAWFVLHRIREADTSWTMPPTVAPERADEAHQTPHRAVLPPAAPDARPWVWWLIGLGLFGLGVAVGRLTKRFR